MKPLSLFTSGQSLARHDDRAPHSPLRSFPPTDYHFHTSAEDVVAVRDERATIESAELRAFRKISIDFMDGETHRNSSIEMVVFALVTGVVAWPLISLLIVLAQTANG